MSEITELERLVTKVKAEKNHLFFTRYFFKKRQNIKFIVNWHHKLIADAVQQVIEGKIKNLVINVPPGSSKTEMVVINLIARGLALNNQARFLHLSYSDDLAALNSQTARDLIRSDEFQELWPLEISDDTKSKKRWNVMVNGKIGGGVYATSLAGQITGFRAGHMTPGFSGCILIDDPLKPEDAFSKSKMDAANRKLLTTVKSRKANPDVPIIVIMQRIAEDDPTGFIKKGNLGKDWTHIMIPAVLDQRAIDQIPESFKPSLDTEDRISYWPYKEPLEDLLSMERGEGQSQTGGRISRHVFSAQYQQDPVALGGNLIRGEWFKRYKVLPSLKLRKIFADTAQKTKERNDYSVFICFGLGLDNCLYLIDLIRGKWEAPELKKRAIDFWNKHKAVPTETHGQLRQMLVEDKSSGTGLIQELKLLNQIPIKGIERGKDKLTRVMDVVSYIEVGSVSIPEEAPFITDFISECEAFTSDDSHAHDDQIDPLIDAITEMLSNTNKLKIWEQAAG